MKHSIAALGLSLIAYIPAAKSQSFTTPIISTIAGTGSCCYTGDGGAATAAKFDNIQGVATDTAGNVYICDADSRRIRKVSPSGIVTTFAGTGSAGYSGDGGLASAAQVNSPADITIDKYGNIFYVELTGNRIRKINPSGIITTVAGTGIYGHGGDGGAATAATFSGVRSVAVDTSGNLYVGEDGGGYIRKVNTSGIISTIAGTITGYSGDGGLATAARLTAPYGLVVDSSGNIFFSDHQNSRIRKINTSGIISTIAGDGSWSYSGDGGPATAAKIYEPWGITIGRHGHIFFADWGNQRIRQIAPDGTISSLVGDGTMGFAGDGGLSTGAKLHRPYALCVNRKGHLYIADNSNLRVRKVYPATPAAISGTTNVCVGATTIFADATSGGVWSSVTPLIATVGSGTGIVSGVAGGSANISYTIMTVCGSEAATKNIVVDTFPDAGAITGLDTVCVSETITLSNVVSSGTWSSSNSSLGALSGTGIVTGVAAGNITVSYAVTNSCGTDYAFRPVTVMPYEYCHPTSQIKDMPSSSIRIYPNPGDGLINIDLGREADNCFLTVTDLSGRKIMTKALNQRNTTLSLNLESGVYFISINDKSGVDMKKIIIR